MLRNLNLMEAPERIYNIDETLISMEHAPAKIVCFSTYVPQAITSPLQKMPKDGMEHRYRVM